MLSLSLIINLGRRISEILNDMSSAAEGSGLLVPIPIWEKVNEDTKMNNKNVVFFKVLELKILN